ncbi:MAG: ATP-binding protein [Oscillospiraceae bacterium]
MSIKWKMTLWYTLLMVLILAAVLGFMLYISQTVAENREQSLLKSVVERNADEVWFEFGRLETFGFVTYSDGVYLQIYDDEGNLLKGYSPFAVETDTLADQTIRTFSAEGDTIYLYSIRIADDGYPFHRIIVNSASGEPGDASGEMAQASGVWVCGMLPAGSLDNILGSVIRLAFITLPVLVLLAFFGGWFIASKSLAPVRKITETAQEISNGDDLSRRLEIGTGRDEIHTLASTFNDMFTRLERSFLAERQFTSDASHELRTPAAVILAECDMAKKQGNDPVELRQSLEVIERQARKMSSLISRLLMFARLDQGTQKTESCEIDLSALTSAICEEQAAISERGIRLESNVQPDIQVIGDEQLLISLIQNLITNARKYGKPNGHIWVDLHADGELAWVIVRDDGIGIAPEELPMIWRRFYQVDRARSNRDGSLGLGLSMAREIARIHNGQLTAESVPDEGSSFIFSMPLAKAV